MWHQVTVPFARLLGNNLYPALFENADYQKFLQISGITPPYPSGAAKLSSVQQDRLAQNANLRANLLALELDGLQSLEHARARAVEISGPKHIYRLWNSQVKASEFRFFWFTEDLLLESFQQAGGRKKDRLEWLRGQMAVAYNWSLCDKIARLRLRSQDTIPGVEATGLPIRGVAIRQTDPTVRLPSDYFSKHEKYSAMLPGGAPQLFLYLVPETRVEPYW